MKHKTSVMAQRNRKNSHIKKIGLVTGGGDCPGLNAVIRAVVISAINRGWEVYGIEHGFEGLLYRNRVHLLNTHDVRGIIHTGGTILGTTNRGNPFKLKVTEDGETRFIDISDKVVEQFHSHELESLIVIGGDGTLSIASDLAKKGIPVIGVPKTIDNDLMATEMTFGFSTAVATATDAIDKLHATAASHERVMIVEVMGRYAGWIALYSGVAGGEMIFKASEDGREPRLGGIAERLADDLNKLTGYETRSLVLGHLQRGGQPTPTDRLLATRFGAAAVRAIECGKKNVMVALQSSNITTVPLAIAIRKRKQVPRDYDVIQSARDLGVSFGDE